MGAGSWNKKELVQQVQSDGGEMEGKVAAQGQASSEAFCRCSRLVFLPVLHDSHLIQALITFKSRLW